MSFPYPKKSGSMGEDDSTTPTRSEMYEVREGLIQEKLL
jgi:hypothetical protein